MLAWLIEKQYSYSDLNIKFIDLQHQEALLNRGFGSTSRSSHERLQIGDIVQLLIESGHEQERFPISSTTPTSCPTFFVLGGFIRSVSGVNWALVKRCSLISPSRLGQLPDMNRPPFIEVVTTKFYDTESMVDHQYLELSNCVRKVGVLHNCSGQGSCQFCSQTRRVVHSRTTLDGCRFFILTRSMAYPPRRSWCGRKQNIIVFATVLFFYRFY